MGRAFGGFIGTLGREKVERGSVGSNDWCVGALAGITVQDWVGPLVHMGMR